MPSGLRPSGDFFSRTRGIPPGPAGGLKIATTKDVHFLVKFFSNHVSLFFFSLSSSVLSRNPDFKFGGGQFVFLPKFFFQHDHGRHWELVNCIFFFAKQKKKNNMNGAAGENFFGYGVNV